MEMYYSIQSNKYELGAWVLENINFGKLFDSGHNFFRDFLKNQIIIFQIMHS